MLEQPLVFVHIPKAAGFTLKHLFSRIYGERNSVIDLHIFRDKKELFTERSFDFIEGHVPFGIHEQIGGPCQYLTLLRDPYRRVLSHYNHVLAHPDHPLHTRVRQGLTLQQILDEGLFPVQFQNTQTRMIAGGEHFLAHETPAEDLDHARHHLNEYFLFGLLEEFDTSLELWRQRLGFGIPPFEMRNQGRSGYQGELHSEALKAHVELHNRHDQALYSFARSRFAEHKSRCIEELLRVPEKEGEPVHEITVNGVAPNQDGKVLLHDPPDTLRISGWAIDQSRRIPLRAVVTESSGVRDLALYGGDRLGVAHRYENYRYRYCGFDRRLGIRAQDLHDGLEVTVTFVASETRFNRRLRVSRA